MQAKQVILGSLAVLMGGVIFETFREVTVSEQEHHPELYADAYLHASMALVEKYPSRLTSAQMIGADSTGHVYGHNGTFAVEVVYQGWNAEGHPVAKKTAPCTLRYVDGLWIVDHLAVIPEFEGR